jgi:broad specificity phosphatase PhoE
VPDGGRIYGQGDLPCDCGDAATFAALAAALPVDAVWVTSNLIRTRQTAEAILAADPAKFAGVAPSALAELAEQHLGAWQGLDRKAFYAERRVGTHALWFGPADERPPGGESFVDLIERVAPAIARLNAEHRGRDIVAVTHGGTIRAAVGLALGLTPQGALAFATDNCSLTRLDCLSTGDSRPHLWRVVAVNRRP